MHVSPSLRGNEVLNSVLARVDEYYTSCLLRHGTSPRGVDWNSQESQELRFSQLLQVCPVTEHFSLLDYGCGYGALADFVEAVGYDCQYTAYDISKAMIDCAGKRHASRSWCSFSSDISELRTSDYLVASGIFNVKLSHGTETWRDYVTTTLHTLNSLAAKGFAFNMLTSYSDAERMRDDLHYADPTAVFDYCKRNFARNVALLHDYGLYEFTILVRKERDADR
jgi:cyclopropane fatty-acyl-phospholipid synthase-like methyltransferase